MRKGVGVARILWHEKTIDVFTTHMVSYFTKVSPVWPMPMRQPLASVLMSNLLPGF